MFKKALSILFILFSLMVQSQLVNGGFESYSALPSSLGQYQLATGWSNAGSAISSPDYYHYQGSDAADLPETPYAMVDPQQGESLMGFVACGRPNTNIREYISTEFSSPLLPGRKYMIGFKITNGVKTSTSLAGLAVDQLGLFFSLNPLTQNGQNPILENPQLYIESVVYSQDWQSFNFIFTPDQPYRYLNFGLFGDDTDKEITIQEGSDPLFAYYFVDNFNVDLVSNETHVNNSEKDPGTPDDHQRPVVPSFNPDELFYVPNTFTPNGDGNNEFFAPVSSVLKEWQFEIFSKWGERVFVTEDETRGWDGSFNGMNCGNGSYVWQISYMLAEEGELPKRVEYKGIVNLVR